MDLKHDWKALNEVLFENHHLSANASSLVLLEEDGKIVDGVVSDGKTFDDRGVDGVAESKDLLDSLAARYGADQALVLSKKSFDQYVIEAASFGSNYFQQLQTLREKVTGELDSQKSGFVVSRKHFILDLFGSRLRRVLPRRFNVLLFVDQRPSTPYVASVGLNPQTAPLSYRSILLSYTNGKLDQFFEPDFSSLHENRLIYWQQQSDAIGEYLESRYILPCYCLMMYKEDWDKCQEAAAGRRKPWNLFVRFFDEGRSAIFPNRWLVKSLLALQRVIVYFSRL